VVARVFADEAARWPMAQWPVQYWRLLLATPPLRSLAGEPAQGLLPGIAGLPPAARTPVLLQLVSGLDDAGISEVLGLPAAQWQGRIRDALPSDSAGQPDLDTWRVWQAQVRQALAAPAVAPMPAQASASPASPARVRLAAADAGKRGHEPRHASRHVPWLWLGVMACVAAFVAAFMLYPVGREAVQRWLSPIKREALPPAEAPAARYDATDLQRHPDRELLVAPREAAFARDLPLLAWLQASNPPELPPLVPLPDRVRPATVPMPEAADASARRLRAWERLPMRVRGERRRAWQAWRRLPAADRVALREVAVRWQALPAAVQAALHARFASQPYDARMGWWLGPRIGAQWPRVAALFAFVDAGERQAVLQLLHAATPEQWDALARLAQSTPPEARAELRRALLAQPAEIRTAWLQERLQR
jgi:hypothetical protein